MIKLIQGNCLDQKIIDKFMLNNENNVMITSPPYNMNLRIRNGKYCSRQITKEFTTKYENFSDNLSIEEYFEFNKNVIETYLDFCPIIFYNVQFLTGNKKALYKLIGYFSDKLKEIIVWDKVNSQPAIGVGILNSQYEVILVFDKYNAISRKFNDATFKRGTMSNVWHIKRGKKVCKTHGAVFPPELVENIINNLIDKTATIIDPFMGTGTTGVVAKQHGQDFIGIELYAKYYEIAKNRINNSKEEQ